MNLSNHVYDIDIQVEDAYAGSVDVAGLQRAAEETLRQAARKSAALTIAITGDEHMHELNRTYRGVDAPTDVLSFASQDDAGEDRVALALPPELADELASYLGDIIIALPYTERQAAAFDNSLDAELRLLAIHGALHLLGYDHDTPEAEAEMWAAQDAALIALGDPPQAPRSYPSQL